MSDEEGETEIRNLHLTTRLRKNVQKKVHQKLDFEIAQLAEDTILESDSELNLKDFADDFNENCSSIISVSDNSDNVFDQWTDFNFLDVDDYGNTIENLSNDKSALIKIKAVRNLIKSHVIDVNSIHWSKLSQNLQLCVTHTNTELYKEALKLQYKIISFRHSSCEGYLSLLQGLDLLLNSRCFLVSEYSNTNLRKRVTQILKILLKTQTHIIKNCAPVKQKVMEDIVVTFTTLLCKLQEGNNILFKILCTLDSHAIWFSQFCYVSNIRNVVIQNVTNFAQYTISLFIKIVDNDDTYLAKKSSKSDSYFLMLSHCVHFLTKLLEYDHYKYFSFTYSDSPITIIQLISLAVSKLSICVRGSKIQTLLTLFVKNLTSFVDLNTVEVLLEPLDLKIIDKYYANHISERYEYIIDILNQIAHSSSSYILFGCHSTKNKKNLIGNFYRQDSAVSLTNHLDSPIRTVTEFTILCVRNCINRMEDEHQIRETIIKWLYCCKNLYAAHPSLFLICNSIKLTTTIRDLYEVMSNYSVNIHYKMDIVDILRFFIAHHLPSIQILANECDLISDILNFTLLTKHLNSETWLCITNIARDLNGCEIITNNHNKIVLPCLEQTWLEEENEINFMDGNDIEKETDASGFLKTFSIISSCYRTFDALLRYENEDTVSENDDKPLAFADLLASCFDVSYNSDFSESYSGLLMLKMLISNANIALFLESNYKLQVRINYFCIELRTSQSLPLEIHSVTEKTVLVHLHFYFCFESIFASTFTTQCVYLNTKHVCFRSLITIMLKIDEMGKLCFPRRKLLNLFSILQH